MTTRISVTTSERAELIRRGRTTTIDAGWIVVAELMRDLADALEASEIEKEAIMKNAEYAVGYLEASRFGKRLAARLAREAYDRDRR